MKRFLLGFSVGVLVVVSAFGGAVADRLVGLEFLNKFLPEANIPAKEGVVEQRVLREESVVVNVAEAVSPSVVTVSVTKQRQTMEPFFLDPFGMFEFRRPGRSQEVKQDIGSGFIIDAGLVVTNKHVVSDATAAYKIITKDDQEHDVAKIYRDPTNDIAILKVDGLTNQAVKLGDSDQLKVGQFVIAIGTALGEFRHTVTTGVISGLGRGIQAGDPFGGLAEQLDNVIQTDAAINPGNSGGPLLNSAGQVIGVNVAVAQSGQNIGFALPINTVKQVVDSFRQTGSFERPFLGVRYQMISTETALMNDVPAGAYIVEVVDGSPAAVAGLKTGDIIVRAAGQKLSDADGGLAGVINSKKVGENLDLEIFRDGKTISLSVTLTSQ
jgi:S1-C subfamily serine protease